MNIFITGANRGLGLEMVQQFLKVSPANIFATFREESSAEELKNLASTNSCVHPLKLDVSKSEDFPHVVKEVENVLGPEGGLNLLINNAGLVTQPRQSLLTELKKEDFQKEIEVNLYGPVFLTQAFLPLLERASASKSSEPIGPKRAVVINITSKMGSIDDNGSGGVIAYRTTKSALNSVGKTLNLELIKKGILMTNIHPGWVRTRMGGPNGLIDEQHSVSNMITKIMSLTEQDGGKFFNYDGKIIPW